MWWQELSYSIYLLAILLVIIAILLIEAIRHRAALAKIPVRVHVNGTRGKSSVARLIAAGLRAGGLVTTAKTTGTLARFIYPDGKEEDIYRMGHTNIAEQIKIVRKAAQLKTEVLVIECMSLQPLLQSLCELKLVKSTHGVLTNARPDHLDVMGPLEEDVALALAGTVPVNGKYFTPEKIHLRIFQNAVSDRGSELVHIDNQAIAEVTDEEIAKFSYQEFKENVALALAVCQSLNVDRNVALAGMWAATPDPGAMSIYQTTYHDHKLIFANGFAANDPVSTEMLWHDLLNRYPQCEQRVMIINCRVDRPERSTQLGEAVVTWQLASKIILIGSGVKTFIYAVKKAAKEKSVTSPTLVDGEGWETQEILDNVISAKSPQQHLVIGIGNIANIGLKLVNYFQNNKE